MTRIERTRAAAVAVMCTAALWAAPASAQGINAGDAGQNYVAAVVGVQSVQNVGAQAGLEVGRSLSDKLEVFGELSWLQDTVTRRRLDTAKSIASFLQTSQGATATSDLSAPAVFGGAGVRLFVSGPRTVRPYVVAQAGVARVTVKPAFTIAGADVTEKLTQYGVSLGSDLTGSTSKAAFGGGFGVLMQQGLWRIDAGLRVLSIQTDDQATNVLRLSVGVGRTF